MARQPNSLIIKSIDPVLLSAYKRILRTQFFSTLALIALMIASLLGSLFIERAAPSLLLLVMATGIMGALFSALIRTYGMSELSFKVISPVVSHLDVRHLLMHSSIPLLIGAIGSVVLYVLFIAEFLRSGLFPEFKCSDGGCNALADILRNYSPKSASDYGKALIWAFLAGFSERLVPDTLQRIASKQATAGK